MTSPKEQNFNKKKLEDDPYYIPSVPMYCVLGQELDDTIGDLFFDLNPKSFQQSPPIDTNTVREMMKKDGSINSGNDGAVKKIVIGDVANMTMKLKPRQSRSLIKPGRPSVAKKLSQASAPNVEEVVANLNNAQVVDTAVAKKKSAPLLKRTQSTKSVVSEQPVVPNGCVKRKPGTSPMQKSVSASQLRLRSAVNMDGTGVLNQNKLATPVKRVVSNTLNMQLRSSTKKQANTPEITQAREQAISCKQTAPLETEVAKVPPARRSRSLVKPGRPSVASKIMGPPAVPAIARQPDALGNDQRIIPEVQIVAEVISKLSPVVKPRKKLNKPSVMRDVFSTKKTMVPPPTQPIATRLRSSKGTQGMSITPLNASSSSKSARSETPSVPRSRASSYMAPTLSSSRRKADISDSRGRLPSNK